MGADTTSLTLTTEDDAPIEDPSTVTVTIEADADAAARYQAAPGAATADVVVLDDLPRFLLKVGPAEVTEGGGGAVTVEIDNGVSLATAQTISLTLGGTATADDFTLLSTSDATLSAPYTLTIPANEGVAAAYITTVNDALPEPAETLTITASHDGTDIGTGTMTLRASSLRLELSSLTASGGGGRAMYPSFDAGTLHYAVGCDPSQTLTLRLTTRDATTRLAVNGVQQVSQNAVVALNQLDGDDDILIALSDAAGANTTYVVYCMNSTDPVIGVVKRPGSAIELIAGSVNAGGRDVGARGHLLVIDANGVPRSHRRIDNPRVTHFRPQDNQEFPYSHAAILPKPESTDRSLTGRDAGLPESLAGVPASAGRCRSEQARLGGAEGAGAGSARRARACWREPRGRAGAVSGRQAGSGIARSRASAAANCPAQGQRFGRCRVQRRAEWVSRPASAK